MHGAQHVARITRLAPARWKSHAHASHPLALLGAFATSAGTMLTVFGLVFAAFRGARFANLRADSAEIVGITRATAHESRSTEADFRAVSVEPNALSHFLDVRFAQAGICAMFTHLGTFNTGCDAGRELFVRHFGHSNLALGR
jgi:hypothetical protein